MNTSQKKKKKKRREKKNGVESMNIYIYIYI